jgi:hypothetical protein
MTFVGSRRSAPLSLLYTPTDAGGVHDLDLPVNGQGTVAFAIEAPAAPFGVALSSELLGSPELRLSVDGDGARLILAGPAGTDTLDLKGDDQALDPEPRCVYWLSIDCRNRALIYGKGEMRLGCAVGRCDFEEAAESADDPWSWLREIRRVRIEAELAGGAELFRDPVVGEPPMYVVGHDQFGMDDIGAGVVTVPANLSQRCQQLYDAVAGAMFELDTPDFRHFSDAIAASIKNPAGWCAKTLAAKAARDEFGDKTANYLRITAGRSQGESPGIPYVLEIWPSGDHSPIHNHGGSDAVIRVLSGQIKVSLYPMLSSFHETPFAEARFNKGDVTWISARLNQVHKLENDHPDPCITIQCYMYADTDTAHWPYFDFLGQQGAIGHFDPTSDCDYDKFKSIMRAEWDNPPGEEEPEADEGG